MVRVEVSDSSDGRHNHPRSVDTLWIAIKMRLPDARLELAGRHTMPWHARSQRRLLSQEPRTMFLLFTKGSPPVRRQLLCNQHARACNLCVYKMSVLCKYVRRIEHPTAS